jgi:acylphosphatase
VPASGTCHLRQAVVVVRFRVRVTGRVQGVWYRESCRQVADRIGVAGWVRNEPDGSVAAVVEGEEAAVDRLLEWMRTGPRHAVVTDVAVEAEEPRAEHGFDVR